MATFGLVVPYIGGKSKNGNYLSQIIAKNGNIWTRLATEHSWDEASLGTRLSLVPRPFPPPVFDRILYAKTDRREGLGERVTCVTSGRREGRH